MSDVGGVGSASGSSGQQATNSLALSLQSTLKQQEENTELSNEFQTQSTQMASIMDAVKSAEQNAKI
jgi:hypothetical protein